MGAGGVKMLEGQRHFRSSGLISLARYWGREWGGPTRPLPWIRQSVLSAEFYKLKGILDSCSYHLSLML